MYIYPSGLYTHHHIGLLYSLYLHSLYLHFFIRSSACVSISQPSSCLRASADPFSLNRFFPLNLLHNGDERSTVLQHGQRRLRHDRSRQTASAEA